MGQCEKHCQQLGARVQRQMLPDKRDISCWQPYQYTHFLWLRFIALCIKLRSCANDETGSMKYQILLCLALALSVKPKVSDLLHSFHLLFF